MGVAGLFSYIASRDLKAVLRINVLKLYFEAYKTLYSGLPDPPSAKDSLAAEHASAQEGASSQFIAVSRAGHLI